MDESDQEMSEDVDSDNEAWAALIPGPDERREQCKLGKETLLLPELFLEKVSRLHHDVGTNKGMETK